MNGWFFAAYLCPWFSPFFFVFFLTVYKDLLIFLSDHIRFEWACKQYYYYIILLLLLFFKFCSITRSYSLFSKILKILLCAQIGFTYNYRTYFACKKWSIYRFSSMFCLWLFLHFCSEFIQIMSQLQIAPLLQFQSALCCHTSNWSVRPLLIMLTLFQ